MWKSPAGTVWALTPSGPRRYAAGAWVLHALPAGESIGAQIYGTTETDLTVSTASGDACTWGGSAWSCVPMPPGFFNDQRVVKTGARTWLVADLLDGTGAYEIMIMRK
jgi:hypothetical protein